MIFITGGAGFIGANFILDWLATLAEPVINIDKLTYAGNIRNLESVITDPRHTFVYADICESARMRSLFNQYQPRAVIHFAAESHVDRSILAPEVFMTTNIGGTHCLLEAARDYCSRLPPPEQAAFRFLHISTDEVYGSLQPEDAPFSETTPYAPNSPYSASKAASDHLVRAYHHTYGLPTLTTHCSNNYGRFHFPEKLIPMMIVNALGGRTLPLYGDGLQVRDWLHVSDHCAAIRRVLQDGQPGETYNIGGRAEKTNLEVAHALCAILDRLAPRRDGISYTAQISHVADRAGHDRRYAIDARKMEAKLGWKPAETFATGLEKTVQWYLDNPDWTQDVQSGVYRSWIEQNYGERGTH